MDAVWLTPEARRKLRTLPEAIRAVAGAGEPASAKPSSGTRPNLVAEFQATLATKRETPVAAEDLNLNPAGSTKAEKLDWLREKAKDWQPARDLDSLRQTMVFAVGSPDADLMFVGEAPGAEEEKLQEPFVGPAGQLLTKIIGVMGLERSGVYISNICKFRPALPNQTNNNRKPTAAEMASCLPFVKAEIEVVRPKVIVALGGTATEGLLGIEEAKVGAMRSRFHDLDGVPVMVTYHPSYLLRNQTLTERRKVWEDLLMVMERLGLPISDKQRSFFLK